MRNIIRHSLIVFIITALLNAAALSGCAGREPLIEEPKSSVLPGTETALPSETGSAPVNGTTPLPTLSPAAASDAPIRVTAAPSPSGIPSEPPSSSVSPFETPSAPVLAGTVSLDPGCEVLYDLDLDGKPETVLIGISDPGLFVLVKVGSDSAEAAFELQCGAVISAYICDTDAMDGRAELVISVENGIRDHKIVFIRLNAGSDALESFVFEGSIAEIKADSFILLRLLDIMGTWDCLSEFRLSEGSFGLEAVDGIWTVSRTTERWCTVFRRMLIGLYTSGADNETAVIEPGVRMYPVSTDMRGVIDVYLDTGALGYITIELDGNGRPIYSGYGMDHWFSDLTFIE